MGFYGDTPKFNRKGSYKNCNYGTDDYVSANVYYQLMKDTTN